MCFGSAGSTAMCGSLFGKISSQSSRRLAEPVELVVRHSTFDGLSPGLSPAVVAPCCREILATCGASGRKCPLAGLAPDPAADADHWPAARTRPSTVMTTTRDPLIESSPADRTPDV